ncbi:MAG: DUF2911 domain-containing protein [Chitinophagaceae bacterium]
MTQHFSIAKKRISTLASVAIIASAIVLGGNAALAQNPPASPPSEATASFSGKMVSVKYGAPSVKGRKIFGEGGRIASDKNFPIWRAGANSATAFHTDTDLEVGTIKVPKGDYTLYVDLTNPDKWELIISKQTGQWGLTYSKEQDLGRTKMTMSKPSAPVETLKYTLSAKGAKGTLMLEWENHAGTVPLVAK